MKFVALVAIVPEEREEEAVELAKNAGAGAVTILRGRNLGLKEKKIFFGLTLEENDRCFCSFFREEFRCAY